MSLCVMNHKCVDNSLSGKTFTRVRPQQCLRARAVQDCGREASESRDLLTARSHQDLDPLTLYQELCCLSTSVHVGFCSSQQQTLSE